MFVNIYVIASPIHDQEELDISTNEFIGELKQLTGRTFNYRGTNFSKYTDKRWLNLIFIHTDGLDGKFKELYPSLKAPFYLLTTGRDNSLTVSMEILSFLRDKRETAKIIQGNIRYVEEGILWLAKVNNAYKTLHGQNLKFRVIQRNILYPMLNLKRNLCSKHLCRKQVVLKPRKAVDYFLRDSIGRHHIIMSGNYEALIDGFFNYKTLTGLRLSYKYRAVRWAGLPV
ncbi:MAG: hypothetical protein LBL90_01190 [Prevotellaceae bacterium]|jgi:hypothetical protein|nr:hypothetical protein [Prevotellaceae bacterium]